MKCYLSLLTGIAVLGMGIPTISAADAMVVPTGIPAAPTDATPAKVKTKHKKDSQPSVATPTPSS